MAYGELRANANAKQKPEVPTVKTNAAQKPSANSAAHFAVAETIRQAIAEEMALPEPDADKVLGHYELLDAQMLKAYSALKSEQAGQTPSSARARALRAMATAVTGKERDFLIAKAEECEARLAAMSDRAGLPAAPERYRDKPPPRSYDIALQRRKERGY
jgi:hypothetical protein